MKRQATMRACEQRDRDPDKPDVDQKVCLFSQDGTELLGRHPDEESAKEQEAAIHAGSVERNTMKKKYIKLAEVPEAAVKSLYDQRWGEGIMKSLGEDFPLDSKAAQFLFHSVWNAVIQLMDKSLMSQDTDTTKFADDPTFMQSLAGLAYFVTDDAIKSSLGIKSDSLQKGAGHAEALMAVLGKEADAAATLEGLKQKALPIVDKAFDQVTSYLKEAPEPQQKAASTKLTRAEVFCAVVRQASVPSIEAFLDAALGKYDEWFETDAGDHYLREFDNLVKGWATLIDEVAKDENGDSSSLDHHDVPRELALILFKLDPGWERPKAQQSIYLDLKDAEEAALQQAYQEAAADRFAKTNDTPATEQDIVAAFKEVAPKDFTPAESADASIGVWAQGLPRDASGPATIWLHPVVAMDASADEWLTTAEAEGLYVPAQHNSVPYVQEYLQQELNEQVAAQLNETTAAGTAGTFSYAEQNNTWGLQYETPAVEDVMALMVPQRVDEEAEESIEAVTETAVEAVSEEPTEAAPAVLAEVMHRGYLYREATEAEAREARETSRGPDHRPKGRDRDRDSRAPSMQLTQQVGKLPKGKQKRKPAEEEPEKESLFQRGLKWLDKKSHEAATDSRSRWGRLRKANQETPMRRKSETVRYDPGYSGVGKFDSNVDEYVYELALDGWSDESIGDVEDLGYYDLVVFEPGDPLVVDYDGKQEVSEAAIMVQNNQGFVSVKYYAAEQEARADWQKIEVEYADFYDEVERENPGYYD